MDAKAIRNELVKFGLAKEVAAERRRIKAQAINEEYAAAVGEGNAYESKLMDEVVPMVEKYLNSKAKCECQMKHPDQIELTVDGVWIFFDADHPNDCREKVIPYAELNT